MILDKPEMASVRKQFLDISKMIIPTLLMAGGGGGLALEREVEAEPPWRPVHLAALAGVGRYSVGRSTGTNAGSRWRRRRCHWGQCNRSRGRRWRRIGNRYVSSKRSRAVDRNNDWRRRERRCAGAGRRRRRRHQRWETPGARGGQVSAKQDEALRPEPSLTKMSEAGCEYVVHISRSAPRKEWSPLSTERRVGKFFRASSSVDSSVAVGGDRRIGCRRTRSAPQSSKL